MLSHVVSSFSGGLPAPDGLSTVVVMDGAAGTRRRHGGRRVAAVLAVVTVTFGTFAVDPPASAASAAGFVRPDGFSTEAIIRSRTYIFGLSNIERSNRGLPRLAFSSALTNACQGHANDMAAMRRMTHIGSDGSNGGTRAIRRGFSWSAWGENVAAGYTSSQSLVAGWMNSAGHRANILSRTFTHMGVGLQRGSNNVNYFCMLLARP